jgi:hypothetical protein
MLLPLLVAASDPSGDVVGCGRRGGAGAPDLLRAEGHIVELGTSARWTLTFAEPLTVPDDEGRPFRVDIAIRDPAVPALSFAYFHKVNRLVRVDATIGHGTEIYLLPERGANVFNPPVIEGAKMTIQVPGRTLSADEDLTGTSPGLEELRWTVIVRDERACDFLGNGRPRERLLRQANETSAPPVRSRGSAALPWVILGGSVVILMLIAIAVYQRRRTSSITSPPAPSRRSPARAGVLGWVKPGLRARSPERELPDDLGNPIS